MPPTQTIAYQAFKSVRPGEEPAFSVDIIYYQMYSWRSASRWPGPNLTPETFQQGMYDYPPQLGPFGLWDFGPGDHTSADDVREIYWDPQRRLGLQRPAGRLRRHRRERRRAARPLPRDQLPERTVPEP